jgi:predicted benzoate:H+ symporter BenE
MSLADLVRGARSEHSAAAIVATVGPVEWRSVAKVASAAVANHSGEEQVSSWLLLHYIESDVVEVACSPAMRCADVLALYPNAVAAQPFTPTWN